jgi:hypothetical protein
MKTHAVSQLSYFSNPQLSSREALLYACFGERVLRQRPVAYTSRVIHTDPRGCLLQGLGPGAKTLLLSPPPAALLPPSQDNSDLEFRGN